MSGSKGNGKHSSSHGSMGQRGVTRPMAEMQMSGHSHGGGEGHKQGHSHGKEEGHGHGMSHEDRLHMLHMHHKQTLWVYWTLIVLGFWVLLSPVTFGYGKAVVDPSGGRAVWLSMSARIMAMTWSDIISGLLLIVFGWRSLTPNRPISLWTCCFVGIWLNAAPLLFWTPSAAAYLNGTLVGAMVIALTVLIPGMPNMIMYMQMGDATPPGWSYNPSSWPQRWIMIVTGFAGWLVSRYLAAFQLGFINHMWDPFFGSGSRQVLNSNMSHSWPISDAALGSFAYTFEFLMGFMGSPSRWRTMPWMVTFFGILVIPLGLVHIFLVISQPVVVGYWCTFCLVAAAIMLPMIPLEVDEVVAMGQHLVQSKRRGESLWRVFWKGGSPEGCTPDKRSPELMELPQKPKTVFLASIWGMSFPWTLTVSTVLGVWLMFTPTIFGIAKPMADIDHVVGALIVTVSVISMGEVVRTGRWLNILLGLAIAITPWFLSGGSTLSRVHGLVVGLVVAALAISRGIKKERYGLWDSWIR